MKYNSLHLCKALDACPSNTDAMHSIGIFRRPAHSQLDGNCLKLLDVFIQGNIDAALECYNEAARLNPKGAAILASRGDAFLASADVAAARSDFLTAARMETDNPRYLYSLACALYSQGNIPEALHFAQEAVRRDGGRNGMYKALVENLEGLPDALKKPSIAPRASPAPRAAPAVRAASFIQASFS